MNDKPSFRATFLRARYTCNYTQIFELGKIILNEFSDDIRLLRAAARTFEEVRPEESLVYWNQIRVLDSADIEALFHCADAQFSRKKRVGAAFEQIGGCVPPAIKEIIRNVIENPIVSSVPDPRIRHIAIGGVSFCGSTLMDRVLGSLPGVRSIGESHWLSKSYKDRVPGPIDFTAPSMRGVPQCCVCGPSCSVLDRSFRAQLTANATNWYFKIAHRLNTHTLISADKNPPNLVGNDPQLRMSCLVLFKSPEQAWASQLDKLPKGNDDSYYDQQLLIYMNKWRQTYETFLDYLKPQGGAFFIHFDEFANDPEAILERIVGIFDLPYDRSVLEKFVPGHAIGGNSKAWSRIRDSGYKIDVFPLPHPDIPISHLERIEKNKPVQDVYNRMLGRFRRLRNETDKECVRAV